MDMPLSEIFEWAAFGGSLLSLYLYGKRGVYGPIAGIATAFLFMAFGVFAGVYAAILANIVFLILHIKNLRSELMQDQDRFTKTITKAGNALRDAAHEASAKSGWWKDKVTGEDLRNNPMCVAQKIALIHSEISEAMEGDRKGLMDDHLPHRSMLEVELADAVIRIMDLSGAYNLDIGGAIAEKMLYNSVRPDHKLENRQKEGGKDY